MDIIWFKRDVRLHDHGPLAAISQRVGREVLLLYLYEPDQLLEPTVHGSHIAFVNEGLLDLDQKITCMLQQQNNNYSKSTTVTTTTDPKSNDNDDDNKQGASNNIDNDNKESLFHSLTVCYHDMIETLNAIAVQKPIARILAHEETGHYASYDRDKRVRKWCRTHAVPFVEFPQMGVTRCLQNRDDFSKHFHAFMKRSQHKPVESFQCEIVVNLNLPGRTNKPLLEELTEIPQEFRIDRSSRQQTGGETQALETLDSFLFHRGEQYSAGISSPNSSWTSCSRLSAYLSWGHVSLRHVIHATKERQEQLKELQKHEKKNAKEEQGEANNNNNNNNTSCWRKSLTAFLSRLHWRSHFIQKLETEPIMEKRDQCAAYQQLRRQPGDWNDEYYQAWTCGKTGFPFVDACMRCLLQHGWMNFRMRAMLVSFACYNLWLDWKKLAPHLARVFLDYEPGIHYPQLQMQAGTTGINAMRVYSVTKQGKDQDPHGIFIRKYVPELQAVPDKYIHEPWKMPMEVQQQVGVVIGTQYYPQPIVNEQESARAAKQKVLQIRNLDETKQQAKQVYEKHGSRNRRGEEARPFATSSGRGKRGVKDNTTTSVKAKKAKTNPQQPSIRKYFSPQK